MPPPLKTRYKVFFAIVCFNHFMGKLPIIVRVPPDCSIAILEKHVLVSNI